MGREREYYQPHKMEIICLISGAVKEFRKSKAVWDLGLSLSGSATVDRVFRPLFKAMDIGDKLDAISEESNQRILKDFDEAIKKNS